LTDPDSSYEIPVIVVATVAAVLVIAIAAFFLVKVGKIFLENTLSASVKLIFSSIRKSPPQKGFDV
jgi:hypothetical protein